MFIRQKKNKSGVISIQIIDKSSGKYKLLKTIGSSSVPSEIDRLLLEAKNWIQLKSGTQQLDFTNYQHHTSLVLDGIEQITLLGPELLLGKIFDQIGFNQIQDLLFRQLVIARLIFPGSKLKTTDYLSKYHYLQVDVQRVYRYLDKLYSHQKVFIEQISYEHTMSVLKEKISIVFYDVTTVYFESQQEDQLRKTGFSKEGKHQHPQIVLGLLVSRGGYPLAYDIFEGNQFEGHTMLPVINRFKEKYNLEKLVVVADAGLLSKENITLLEQQGYEYIIGARIKAETSQLKKQIANLKIGNGESEIIEKDLRTKLIISYSEKRARKDAYNRDRGIKKLEKQIQSGRLTKASINKRGYNKFLQIADKIEVSIDQQKIEEDKKWDGLKGYYTNTSLPKEEVIVQYKELWQIEKAFRITKTDLEIRPIYHRLQRRIAAHICIAFTAYKIYKELERQLKEKKSNLSPEKAIDIAKTIYAIKVVHPVTKEITHKTIIITEEQKYSQYV